VVGRSGAGKTTALVAWLGYLKAQNYRVAACKHSHHPLPPEPPGKDGGRLLATGAAWVGLAGQNGVQLWGDIDWVELLQHLSQASAVDLILVEGGKSGPFPKVEVVADLPPLFRPEQLLGTIRRQGTQPADWTAWLLAAGLLRPPSR
jgi:molybdopterin-guanine dinucleotide biosynthesis protein MobB